MFIVYVVRMSIHVITSFTVDSMAKLFSKLRTTNAQKKVEKTKLKNEIIGKRCY